MNFEVIPAIDLRAGRVVRLRQGDYARETVFPHDPVALAGQYAADGAAWLHVVDLDGARSGKLTNLDTLAAIARLGALKVQAGGGVRSAVDLQRLFDAGVTRVVVGSVAVRHPELTAGWVREFGTDRIVLALDTRPDGGTWTLPVHGWTEDVGITLDALVLHYAQAGARHVLCTDISRDGMLGGFSLPLYRRLREWAPEIRMLASGGACSLDDICAVKATGVSGVVLGRALLEGAFSLRDALAC